MRCKYCYATFDDMHVGPQMPYIHATAIIQKLADAGVKKITFAGGEPLLYKALPDVLRFARQAGLTTSIITNGSLISPEWLAQYGTLCDWIGVSIDSLDPVINELIGRTGKYGGIDLVFYTLLITMIKQWCNKLKINMVVSAYNWADDMNDFISWASPDRWKVFQALRVEGQNDQQFDALKVTTEEFDSFVGRHEGQKCMVPENNAAMTGSYLLVDPLGRLFENSAGRHTYSNSLVDSSVQTCLSQLNLNRDMFIKRGGIYNW